MNFNTPRTVVDSPVTPCPTALDRPSTVLAVATEWFSSRGGLSTFNRRLCIALAAAGAIVYCHVPGYTDDEREHAAAVGVTLVKAPAIPGEPAGCELMRRPLLPAGVLPDLIIGHGRVTGPEARNHVEDHYPGARLVHVAHTEPGRLEWRKPGRDDDAGERADSRRRIDLELGRAATRAAAVGPALHQALVRDLGGYRDVPPPLRLDPGFDLEDPARRRPPAGGPARLLFLGRVDDWEVKGLDLAARAAASAVRLRSHDEQGVELFVRGAPVGECEKLRNMIMSWADCPALHVVVAPYSADLGSLQQDLRRATAVLMPSRAEAFGLVGLEAIVAGTPLLVSDCSGLGVLLRQILPAADASRLVIPMSFDGNVDVKRWGHEAAVLLGDPAAAFTAADRVRRTAARKRTWAMAADHLLRSVDPDTTAR
jgi:glycosyltransferase involved in cell wall biosynthesis